MAEPLAEQILRKIKNSLDGMTKKWLEQEVNNGRLEMERLAVVEV